jgi:hypothetical protein
MIVGMWDGNIVGADFEFARLAFVAKYGAYSYVARHIFSQPSQYSYIEISGVRGAKRWRVTSVKEINCEL